MYGAHKWRDGVNKSYVSNLYVTPPNAGDAQQWGVGWCVCCLLYGGAWAGAFVCLLYGGAWAGAFVCLLVRLVLFFIHDCIDENGVQNAT